jgi:predicted kinase
MNNKTLIMTIGLPRSGKSTWAGQQNVPVVNPDSIRLVIHGKAFDQAYERQVWEVAHIMVKSLFLAGHKTVILDATNVTHKRRSEWFDDTYDVKYKIFNTPKDECIKRAISSKTEYLIPVIERMSNQFEAPLDIDKILLID